MKTTVILLCVCLLLPTATMAEDLRPTDADREAVVRGNNAFAVELYSQLKSQSGNLFFSPESISIALAMTFAGARGETATEMAKVLHFTLPPEKLHPAMGAFLRDRNAAHDGYTLNEADALWGQEGYVFLPDFLHLTKEKYGAGFNTVDFKGNTEVARKTINQWVEQRTANKIKDLLQPGVLTPLARLVLTNAIYFKGNWETQFEKEDTKDEDFHVSAAQAVKAPMMHRTGNFDYYDAGTFQALEIPYQHNDLSMIIFLPKGVDGLAAFEQSLTPEAMQQWLGRLRKFPKVIVSMPKFKMEDQFGLADSLGAMGMKLAFGPVADFSGMDGRRDLYISAIIHKAYVDVNEEGSEAAAATAVVMEYRLIARQGFDPPSPIIFRADHPFFFLIRDNMSGSILFMGRVIDPTK